MAEKRTDNPLVWIAGGCAGLLLIGGCFLCVGPGIFSSLFLEDLFGTSYPAPLPATEHAPGSGGRAGPVLPGPAEPIGPAPDPEDVYFDQLPEIEREVQFDVESVEGLVDSSLVAGTTCLFTVTRIPRGPGNYWCQTTVTCEGLSLYGGEGNGFFNCTFPEDVGSQLYGTDEATTSEDSDGAFTVDSAAGIVSIEDDDQGRLGAFRLTGRIVRVGDPGGGLP